MFFQCLNSVVLLMMCCGYKQTFHPETHLTNSSLKWENILVAQQMFHFQLRSFEFDHDQWTSQYSHLRENYKTRLRFLNIKR